MFFNWLLCITISRYAFVSSEVQTQYGPIEGTAVTPSNGKKVHAFLGVPYAAPPIGPLRFAPPQPPKSWNRVLETKNMSKSCIQVVKEELKAVVWFLDQEPESEDCLYLNVWSPSDSKTGDGLPVMVWIHGGGYIGGTASTSLHDGSTLASENDVIVVSMNYRLDLFGFLYLNSNQVAENVGLQDQILAIKWINQNIRNFGGDPTRITLFGQSMGAVAVGFHMVNLQVSDLFRNAILESGTAEYQFGALDKAVAYKRSLKVAENVGCLDEDVQVMMSCLRNQNVEDLLKGADILYEFASSALGPVRNGVEAPLDIRSAIQNLPPGRTKNVMTGNVPREVGYLITCFLPQEQLTVDLNVTEDDVTSLLTNLLLLEDSRLQSIVLHEYKNFDDFPQDDDEIKKQVADLLGDVLFTCPGVRLTESLSNRAYYYYFNHKPSKPLRLQTPDWMGVIHGDEIPFVFGAPLDPANGYTEDEVQLSKEIMTFWTNFAKTGNPNGDSGQVVWPAVADCNENFTYLILDTSLRLGTSLKERQCDFWNRIYPQLSNLQMQLKNTLK